MPLYQVTCQKHGAQTVYRKRPVSVVAAPCPVCGDPALRDWSATHGVRPFKAYWTEALSKDPHRPIYVPDRETEQRLCKDRGFVRVS